VGLRVAASHLRFVARACHANALNAHRQARTPWPPAAAGRRASWLRASRHAGAPAAGAPGARTRAARLAAPCR